MKKRSLSNLIIILTIAVVLSLFCGCVQLDKLATKPKAKPQEALGITADTTIGQLAELLVPANLKVEGFGLVGGLKNTGSSDCPPEMRNYLKQYILKRSSAKNIRPNNIINSRETAVVKISATLPTTYKSQRFNLKVSAIDQSQTTSLENGWLYEADLKPAGHVALGVRTLATAQGPVFTVTETNKKTGYILGGGISLGHYKLSLSLIAPDYRSSSLIQNRINGRFGEKTANAVSASIIELNLPRKYRSNRKRFIAMVKSLYIIDSQPFVDQRIDYHIDRLQIASQKYTDEVALEAIGTRCFSKLKPLLNSQDTGLRLSVARCLLNLKYDKAFDCLREIAIGNSSYKIEALTAIEVAASRNDISNVARKVIQQDNFQAKLAASDILEKLNDTFISIRPITQGFYVREIMMAKNRYIHVSRSNRPVITIFGSPLTCKKDIFLQSPDLTVTINSSPDQGYVSIIQRHPTRKEVLVNLKCSYEVGDIIERLCNLPVKNSGTKVKIGLGLSYCQVVDILRQMCEKGIVDAQFKAGPLPTIN